MAKYSVFNQVLDQLNPEAEEWSAGGFDEVEKHACIQSLHLSYIQSLSSEEKRSVIEELNLSAGFFDDAVVELSKQLNESEAETLLGIRILAQNTSLLLAQGGDDRLTLDIENGKINKYNASTFVKPGVIYRGSSTCSNITPEGLAVAKEVHQRMIKDVISGVPISQVMMEENDGIRYRLQLALKISPEESSIVLFPSGSDAELLPSLTALIRSHSLCNRESELSRKDGEKPKVFNFIVGAGEVGSGTAKASGVRHFSDTPNSPSDQTIANGVSLEGVSDENTFEVIEFKARSPDGAVALQEDKLCETIREKLTGPYSQRNSVAILHVVIGTKTGLIYPSLDLVKSMQTEFGERLLVVIDACQLRCKLSMVGEYVQLGAFVLITGSKFFCGPPFSGAVVTPCHLFREFEAHLTSSSVIIPKGLQSYLTPYDIPKEMPSLRSFLTIPHNQVTPRKPWMNPGLTLRWSCALHTVAALSDLSPEAISSYMQTWVREVQNLINSSHPYLQCLEEKGEDGGSNSSVMPGSICSIVSFVINAPDREGNIKCLHFDEMKKIWVEMISKGDNKAALGQPVLLSPEVTVLRVALGAHMLVDALSPESQLDREEAQAKILAETVLVVSKLKELAAKRWERA